MATAKRVSRRVPVQRSLIPCDPMAYRRNMDTETLIRHLSCGSDAEHFAAGMLTTAYESGVETIENKEESELDELFQHSEGLLDSIHSALEVALNDVTFDRLDFAAFAARVSDIRDVVGRLKAELNIRTEFHTACADAEVQIPCA